MSVTVFRVKARLISPAVGSSCQPARFKFSTIGCLPTTTGWSQAVANQTLWWLRAWLGLGWVANSDNWLRRWFPAVRDFLEKLRLSPPAPPPDNQFKMEADTAASYMR